MPEFYLSPNPIQSPTTPNELSQTGLPLDAKQRTVDAGLTGSKTTGQLLSPLEAQLQNWQAAESSTTAFADAVGIEKPIAQPSSSQTALNLKLIDPLLGNLSTLLQPGQKDELTQTPALGGSTTQADLNAVLSKAIGVATAQLQRFAAQPDEVTALQTAFGQSWNLEAGQLLLTRLTHLDAANPLERVTLLPEKILKAQGAYAATTQNIYLSHEFLADNTANPDAIAAVLLEELGHHLDAQLNTTDSPGDEGAIFAALVQGQEFNEPTLAALKAEDDRSTLLLDGRSHLVEHSDLPPINLTQQWGRSGDIPIAASDFDGDGKTDIATWRPGDNIWRILTSSTGWNPSAAIIRGWGAPGDIPIANSDFDGDGKADIVTWRPSTNLWYVLKSSTNWGYSDTLTSGWGMSEDTPLAGADFDGDHKTDVATWRPSTHVWAALKSSTNFSYNNTFALGWGLPGDVILPDSDFDGDGKTDLATWRPSTGNLAVLTSSSNWNYSNPLFFDLGVAGDVPLSGNDFDGDGKSDVAIWRPSDGSWRVLTSSSGWKRMYTDYLGQSGDVPIAGSDFNGDGKSDMAVWHPSSGTWSVKSFTLPTSTNPGVTLAGNDSDNTIQTGAADDTLYGYGGNDSLFADWGNDLLFGGNGDDTLLASDGNDTLWGDEGNDRLDGQADDDILFGGNGIDTLSGGAGKDILDGQNGDDLLYGGSGNDELYGRDGNDQIWGEADNDLLYGQNGNDALYGGDGNDTLLGGAGSDSLDGQVGNDVLQGSDGQETGQIDRLIGGTGADRFILGTTDTLFYDDGNSTTAGTGDYALITDFNPAEGDVIQLQGASISGSTALQIQGAAAFNYFLAATPAGLPQGVAIYRNKPGTEPDELIGIIQPATGVQLPSIGTTTRGNDSDNTLTGSSGIDMLDGLGGNDTIDAGSGDDVLYGGAGNDRLLGGDGSDQLWGEAGDDVLQGSSATLSVGVDRLNGGTGADRFILGTATTLFYDDGNPATVGASDYALIADFNPTEGDTIELQGATIGGSTTLQIQGANASSYFFGEPPAGLPVGIAVYRYQASAQPELLGIIQSATGVELSIAGVSFTGNGLDNIITTGIGNDTLSGLDGNDRLDAKGGRDLLYGGNGNDTLLGGDGSDQLWGEAGDDVLQGAATPGSIQIDRLTGGAGADRFVLDNFYDDGNVATAGTSDYALITDFNPTEGDVIQLSGASISGSGGALSIQGNEAASYFLAASPSNLPSGIAIYRDKLGAEPDELIGIIQGAGSVGLSIAAVIAAPTNLTLAPGSDTGTSSSDRLTRLATPTLQGQAQAGTTVALWSEAGVVVGQGMADAQGRWAITTTALANGQHWLTALAADSAGNLSASSTALGVVIDAVLPELNLTSAITSSPLRSTSRLTGTVNGTGSTIASLTYEFNDQAPITVTLNDSGGFDQAIDLAGLLTGSYTLDLTATDTAGNTRTTSFTVGVDTPQLIPSVIETQAFRAKLTQDTGASAIDGITSNPSITGEVLLSGNNLAVSATLGDPTTGNWTPITLGSDRSFSLDLAQLTTLNGGSLVDGAYTVYLRAKDAQGNWLAPAPLKFKLDSKAPDLQVKNLVDGIAWMPGEKLGVQVSDFEAGTIVSYRFDAQPEQSIAVSSNALVEKNLTLPTAIGSHALTVSSMDAAGNSQAVTYNFLVKDNSPVLDNDVLPTSITIGQDPAANSGGGSTQPQPGAPAGPNGSWGYIGRDGYWGFSTGGNWTLSPAAGSGGGNGGGGDPNPPRAQCYPYVGSGYGSIYVEKVGDILDYAIGSISNDATTAPKKAALSYRDEALEQIAGWLEGISNRPDFDATKDELLFDRMQPVLYGLYDKAHDGILRTCEVVNAGYDLARAVVTDPIAVRVKVYETALFAVVDQVFTDRGYAMSEELVAALKQLSYTYVKLNPNPEAGTANLLDNFLDPLWRIQAQGNGYSTAQLLDQSVAALKQLLTGVNDPTAALKFVNNLLQATTNVVSLNQPGATGQPIATKDAGFLRELVDFAFEYAKLNPTAVPAFAEKPLFLNVLWKDLDEEKKLKDGAGGFAEVLKKINNPIELIKTERNLLTTLAATTSPELKALLHDPSYVNGLIEIGSYYPRTQPSSLRNDVFYKVWKAQTDAELQTIASTLSLNDLPTPYNVASGKIDSGNPGRANRQGPLSGIAAYWVPSTNSLFTQFPGNHNNSYIEDANRIAFFEALIDPLRDTDPNSPGNQSITTVYFDVLAPAGATVHHSNPNANNLNDNLIHNILENDGFTQAGDLIYDDAISEFVHTAHTVKADLSKVNLSAWIEGSAYVLPGDRTDADGKKYKNQLYEKAIANNAVLGTDSGTGAVYLDLLNDGVFDLLKSFILDVANRSEIDDIMLDDHFGIHKDVLEAEIQKQPYRFQANAAWNEFINSGRKPPQGASAYASLVFNNFDKLVESGQNFANELVTQWVRNRLTQRLSEIKSGLASIKGGSVTLSISANPFDFRYDNVGGVSQDSAMNINTQDVATWFEQGLITGTLNVQIYRSDIDDFKLTYNALRNQIRDYLNYKAREMSDSDFSSFVDKLPKISISIAQNANNKDLSLNDCQKQADYIASTDAKILDDTGIARNKLKRDIPISVVGFDFHRFENLKNGTVTVINDHNVETDQNGEPWGIV